MIVYLIRILLLALFVFLIYAIIKYVFNPKRKLELAHEQKNFYMLDKKENIRKNFLLTYKGVLFEGEKYLGTTDKAFEVISIFIFPKNTSKLQGLEKRDFEFIEKEVRRAYPNAIIDWKSPIKEFLKAEKS
ncbi:sigma-w pathway protein ysdB [Sutcliffiella cohnii]|uniref:Sigma-w pathway protein ysdB n=1 Tax=Sutcliffiella cohnii TaxID=33932 RepID=A0A223KTW1_9BACI|nr:MULTISPECIES: sigma-w pathway protein ysdB [Sutcliffiella]AST92807.1 sigma-w pathway protein ysdB [Sutcliffiella cohnii]WBL14062.1 sigma-w pathway protein ysdB [Sutcliffiella sp. NC1]